jgi:hypothetical protein
MKIISFLLLPATLALFTACESDKVMLDSAKRAPTTSVEVFKDGATPSRTVKQIADLSWKGKVDQELTAEKKFIREAQAMGGNAVVMVKANVTGTRIDWGRLSNETECLFKAKVYIYE